MPTTSPDSSSSAPPESPGMMSASTSIRLRRRLASPVCSSLTVIGRCRAVTVPVGSGERATVAAGVAHRRDAVTDLDATGVGGRRHQARRVVQPQHGDVLGGVVPEYLRLVRRPGRHHGDRDVGGALDDMMVGDDEPVAADHDAGARGHAGSEVDLARDRHQARRLLRRRLGGVERGGGVRRDVAVRRERRPAPVDQDRGPRGGATAATVSGRASAAAATAAMGRRRRRVDRWSIGMAPRWIQQVVRWL